MARTQIDADNIFHTYKDKIWEEMMQGVVASNDPSRSMQITAEWRKPLRQRKQAESGNCGCGQYTDNRPINPISGSFNCGPSDHFACSNEYAQEADWQYR
jgi:hypothetical protein